MAVLVFFPAAAAFSIFFIWRLLMPISYLRDVMNGFVLAIDFLQTSVKRFASLPIKLDGSTKPHLVSVLTT
jgi:hypothetical protein